MGKAIQYSKEAKREDRPYYIKKDNSKSSIKLNVQRDFDMVRKINSTIKKCDNIITSNCLDTETLIEQKDTAIPYPVYERTNKLNN